MPTTIAKNKILISVLPNFQKVRSIVIYNEVYIIQTSLNNYICIRCEEAKGDNFVILEIDSRFHPLNVDRFKEIKFHKKLKFVLEVIVLGMTEKIMQL